MAGCDRLMRAVRFHEYGDPSVLRLDEVSRPQRGEGEVLVQVRAGGVNPIDWKFRSGQLRAFMPLERPPSSGWTSPAPCPRWARTRPASLSATRCSAAARAPTPNMPPPWRSRLPESPRP